MKSLSKKGLILSCALSAMGILSHSASAEVVSPGNTGDWVIYNFVSGANALLNSNAGFENGPATPPAGTGSFFTQVTTSAYKTIAQTNILHGRTLAGINELSYSTYLDAGSNLNDWYANIYVDRDGVIDATNDRVRLDFIPSGVVTGAWQSFNITTGSILVNGSGGPVLFSAFAAANPNARFNAFNDPMGGAFRLNVGDTSNTYLGFSGNFDAVVIDHDDTDLGRTLYDFEATAAAVPTPAAAAAGLMLLSLLGLKRRRGAQLA